MAAIIALRRKTGISFVVNDFTKVHAYDIDNLLFCENMSIPTAQNDMLKIDGLIQEEGRINAQHDLHVGESIIKPRPDLGVDMWEDIDEVLVLLIINHTDANEDRAEEIQLDNAETLGTVELARITAATALIDFRRETAADDRLVQYSDVEPNVLALAQFLLDKNVY